MSEIYLSSFGGSGENGRNCHCIEVNHNIILLDCGVKREIVNGTVGFYPTLNEEIVSRISCVFLSHCHEDHVAALPLIYHLGYKGKVYATRETILETKNFIKKWMTFVGKKNGVLPYAEEDVEKIQFEEIELGHQVIQGYEVVLGRSGHVLGSCWYVFNFNGKKVLYTGDMVLESSILATDLPDSCDGAIMNGAYAGRVLNQSKQYQKLLESVQKTWANKGSVFLPIPPKGRGIDITLFLDKNLTEGILYVEEEVIKSTNALIEKKAWIQNDLTDQFSDKVKIIKNKEERQRALKANQGIYISGDGMITTDESMEYYEALKGNEKNLILITGHAASGTVGAGVLEETFRKEYGVKAQSDKIIFKVHLDDDDIDQLATHIQAKTVVLFHANKELNENITKRLEKKNIKAISLKYPQKISI